MFGEDERLKLVVVAFEILEDARVAAGFSLEEEEENGSVFGWEMVSLGRDMGFENFTTQRGLVVFKCAAT